MELFHSQPGSARQNPALCWEFLKQKSNYQQLLTKIVLKKNDYSNSESENEYENDDDDENDKIYNTHFEEE